MGRRVRTIHAVKGTLSERPTDRPRQRPDCSQFYLLLPSFSSPDGGVISGDRRLGREGGREDVDGPTPLRRKEEERSEPTNEGTFAAIESRASIRPSVQNRKPEPTSWGPPSSRPRGPKQPHDDRSGAAAVKVWTTWRRVRPRPAEGLTDRPNASDRRGRRNKERE